jgi:hypothetical protein
LENFGYSGFFIEKKQLIPIMNFNKETHQDVDVLFGRKKSEHPYINNFFFTTKSDLIEKIKHAIA